MTLYTISLLTIFLRDIILTRQNCDLRKIRYTKTINVKYINGGHKF